MGLGERRVPFIPKDRYRLHGTPSPDFGDRYGLPRSATADPPEAPLNFHFSGEELAFQAEVEAFCVEHYSLDVMGPHGHLKPGADGAPVNGRFERSYRYTVVDTIGGGTSEVQKNIIAQRGLGCPPSF